MNNADPGSLRPSPCELLAHPVDRASTFRPEDSIAAVRKQRKLPAADLPEICVLDFDGDLTDSLAAAGEAKACPDWPCFHTKMWTLAVDGRRCGLIDRTIGGPYAVLVAEQLAVCGVRVIIGLASAGRIEPRLPVPCVVVADEAIRDEGTSFHYLRPSRTVHGTKALADALANQMATVGLPVRRGLVWTLDAPYRETAEQIERHAKAGALAVEMQAASLFAFASARGAAVGLVAHVTNAVDHDGEPFDKGTHTLQYQLLRAACRGAHQFLREAEPRLTLTVPYDPAALRSLSTRSSPKGQTYFHPKS